MISLKKILNNILLKEGFLTMNDLKNVEIYADKFFHQIGLDVEFTKHFIERVNDLRNGKQITADELKEMFHDTYQKYGQSIAKFPNNFDAVIKDMSTDISCPFIIERNKNEIEMIMKTIMRKKDFKTQGRVLKV